MSAPKPYEDVIEKTSTQEAFDKLADGLAQTADNPEWARDMRAFATYQAKQLNEFRASYEQNNPQNAATINTEIQTQQAELQMAAKMRGMQGR